MWFMPIGAWAKKWASSEAALKKKEMVVRLLPRNGPSTLWCSRESSKAPSVEISQQQNLQDDRELRSVPFCSSAKMEAHMQLNWKLNEDSKLRKTNGNKNMKDKYKFREASLKKRIEVQSKKEGPKKRGPKPRPKPQPMSKYRRKTANLRERQRMGEINSAYEVLRSKIPTPAQPRNAR